MKTQILHRLTRDVVYESEKSTLREAVIEARDRGANLGGVDLGGANLGGANLRGANLGGVDLGGADLRDANLGGADLRGANLGGADLRGANLGGVDLGGADLRGANLGGAKGLRTAVLDTIRDDLFKVLEAAPKEVPALLAALKAGKVDGSTYEGDCACLVGTVAIARGCKYDAMPELKPDSSRPAERWFLAINRGDVPETSEVAAITSEWIEAWLQKQPEAAE